MTPTQDWIRRAYASERRQGRDPITAAAAVRDSYARMIADQIDMFGEARPAMLDSYRYAKQWLALVMARETTQRPGIVTLISSLRAVVAGPAVAQAVAS